MSEADPVKALREWANLCENDERADYPDRALKATEKEWRSMLEASSTDDDSGMVHMFVTARALLAAAPDLLARLEAGEGLLREARARLFNAGLDFGHCAEDDPGRLVGLARGRALEARLAEVAPVVEAAERYAEAQADFVTKESLLWGPECCAALLARNDAEFAVRKAARRLRAARSLRGAGEGGGA